MIPTSAIAKKNKKFIKWANLRSLPIICWSIVNTRYFYQGSLSWTFENKVNIKIKSTQYTSKRNQVLKWFGLFADLSIHMYWDELHTLDV